jgi:hypothetical protein
MEDVVAVEVELDNGQRRYFVTWGRIQSSTDPEPLEKLILSQCRRFRLGGEPLRARVCWSLQEAAKAPFFFEALFGMAQTQIPFGDGYEAWQKERLSAMRDGKEIRYLGNPEDWPLTAAVPLSR